MKKNFLILLLSSLALTSCSLDSITSLFNKNGGDNEQKQNQNDDDNKNTDDNKDDPSSQTTDDEVPINGKTIWFTDRYKDITLTKTYSAVINFNPTEEFTDEEKAGVFSSKDESVATVSKYGVVDGKKVGQTIITYTTNVDHLVCSMTIYVHESLEDIQREYVRVNNVNDIEVGDELIFASTDFGVAASTSVTDGHVEVAPVSFSIDKSKITSYGEDVAEYYVGPSAESDEAFTLETQENEYLAGRNTTGGTKLRYSKNGKDQINWIIERPQGFSEDFIVSYDIADDYWLMFNKINSGDIRFNLYDSNETTLMKKPTIYRKTIIR